MSLTKSDRYKSGWYIVPTFAIELSNKDLPLLLKIQEYFGAGKIYSIPHKGHSGHSIYAVNSIKALHDFIIPHFVKYPLLTIKRRNFLLFKEVIALLYEKKHLKPEGLQKIMSIKSIMNQEKLVSGSLEGVELTSIEEPFLEPVNISDISPEWFTGFTDAEGCFFY